MNWIALGESVAGTSHLARNAPCQDAFRVLPCGPGGAWLMVAVADGAGSSSHGELGASLTCDEFARRASKRPSLQRCAAGRGSATCSPGCGASSLPPPSLAGGALRELACTALFALVGPETAGFGQVGDGFIVIGAGSDHRIVFWPEPAEYANATDFLTEDRYGAALQIEMTFERITEIAVLTDGLQRLALDFATRSPSPDFFRPLFRWLWAEPDTESLYEPFRSFLDSPRVNARTDDDKTLVLAVRRT